MASPPQLPPENVYGIFCGDINANNTARLVHNLTLASNLRVKHVHLLFQSWGGFVGDGIFIYTLLGSFDFDVTVYNAGQVASAGVLAFLGAKHREGALGEVARRAEGGVSRSVGQSSSDLQV